MQIWPDTYTEWIAQCTGRNALAQYAEHANTYVLWFIDGPVTYRFKLSKDPSADLTDWETNHKDDANQPNQPRTGEGTPISANLSLKKTIGLPDPVTADGYEVFTDVHASTVSVAVNVKTSPTGTDPTLQFRIDQLDPADDVTPIGEPVEGGELDAQGNEILTLQIPGTSTVKVSWTVGGIAPSFGSVGATLVGKGSPASTAVNAEGVLEIVGTVPEGGVYNGFPLVTAGLDNAGLVHAIYADSSGRLTVNTIAPAPAGAIEVQVNAEGSVTGSSFLDTFYTITDGYALTLTRMGGSSQKAGKASQVVLFEDPNGDLSVLNTINIPIILMAKSQSEALVSEFTGDGTRRVVLRRERLDGNPTTMTAFFSGFEQEL